MIQSAEIVDNQVQVVLAGSIYIEEAKQVQTKIQDFLEHGYKKFSFDMSAVDYIDSSGLGMLVALHKQSLKKGGCMKISGINGMVREIFELTRLTKVFGSCDIRFGVCQRQIKDCLERGRFAARESFF